MMHNQFLNNALNCAFLRFLRGKGRAGFLILIVKGLAVRRERSSILGGMKRLFCPLAVLKTCSKSFQFVSLLLVKAL